MASRSKVANAAGAKPHRKAERSVWCNDAIELGLKPYDEYVRVMLPVVRRIPGRNRKRLLDGIYEIAAQKVHMEGLKRGVKYDAVTIRRRREKFKRTRAHIKNATRELLSAESSYPEELLHHNVKPVIDEVNAMIAKLEEMGQRFAQMEHLAASVMHPELKTEKERNFPPREGFGPDYSSLLPGMKSTAIDYWFVSFVESIIRRFASETKMFFIPSEYNRIISRSFEAAFGGSYAVDRVKTARRRLRKTMTVVPPLPQGQKA